MTQFDLIVKGGRVATAADVMRCDIGIKDGRVTALAESPDGANAARHPGTRKASK